MKPPVSIANGIEHDVHSDAGRAQSSHDSGVVIQELSRVGLSVISVILVISVKVCLLTQCLRMSWYLPYKG